MKLSEVMTRDPVAVGPETPLKDVAAILLEHRISGVPVIGERLEVLGVVSEADIVVKEAGPDPRDRRLISWLLGGRAVDRARVAARTAAEAMGSPAITVTEQRTVADAARLMTDLGIKRLPVVNDDGVLIGIVTRTDLVRAFSRGDDEIEHEIRELLDALWLDEPGLRLHVERGEVRLSGRVTRRSDAEVLDRLTRRVPGVVDVQSTLRWEWDDGAPVKERRARVAGGSGGNRR